MPPKKGATKSAKKGSAKEAQGSFAQEPIESRSRRKSCPDCGSVNILFDPEIEQLICHDCGQVFQEIPQESKEDLDEITYL